MQMLRSLCWMLFGVGLTLYLGHDNAMVQRVGSTLLVIALLGRLFVYLREHEPSWERINAVGEPKLSILENLTAESVGESLPAHHTPVADVAQRTPVQRLLDEDR